jgi:hypothetical protein
MLDHLVWYMGYVGLILDLSDPERIATLKAQLDRLRDAVSTSQLTSVMGQLVADVEAERAQRDPGSFSSFNAR